MQVHVRMCAGVCRAGLARNPSRAHARHAAACAAHTPGGAAHAARRAANAPLLDLRVVPQLQVPQAAERGAAEARDAL
jgi:hypothetical protein